MRIEFTFFALKDLRTRQRLTKCTPACRREIHTIRFVPPPGSAENAPLGVQDAFIAGRPVIATDLGGHKELLARGGGVLYRPGDVDQLAETMARLASEAELGREYAASIPSIPTMEEHVQAIDEIYAEVLAEHRSARPNEGLG